MLVYFKEMSVKWKPSTFWSLWSKLRTMISLRHQIIIGNFDLLKSFMKNYSKGYKPKKVSILSWDQIKLFIVIKEDKIFLAYKVRAIITG